MPSRKKPGKAKRITRSHGPLAERTPVRRRADLASAEAALLPSGTVRHIVTVQPATGFEYRYESSDGDARIFHLERGGLESRTGDPSEVHAFRAGVSPIERPTRGGFYTSPESIESLSAEAMILIESGVSGDSIICRSYGSYDGLTVTLRIYRENSDGSIERILQERISDADEHEFPIP